MTTITKEQAQKIIDAADEAISALAGTNDDIRPESGAMVHAWDYLNDVAAPPAVVRELARIALASLEANAGENSVHDLFLRAKALMYQSGGSPIEHSLNPVDAWLFEAEEATRKQAEPVSPTYKLHDGWVSCGERLPDADTYVLVSNGFWVGVGKYSDAECLDTGENWQDEHGEFIDLIHHPITHWMPLPAAPQQEAK